MPPRQHRRIVVLFLAALLVPCGVLFPLSIRMIRQERELSEKRRADARELVAARVNEQLLRRLEQIKFQEFGSLTAALAGDHASGATALVARVAGNRLVLPWEEDPSRREFLHSMGDATFREGIGRCEREEFAARQSAKAAACYRDLVSRSKRPAQQAYARLLLARALAKSGDRSQAAVERRRLLALPAGLVDEHGIPLKLYAAGSLLEDENGLGTVISGLRPLADARRWLSPAACYRLRDLVESAPGASSLKPLLQKRIRDVEQCLELRAEFPKLEAIGEAAGERLPAGEQVWIPFGKSLWMVNFELNRTDPGILVAVRAGAVFEIVASPEFRLIASGSDEGRPLGDNFPGLRVAFASAPEAPGHWTLPQYFYLTTLCLIVSVTLFGGYLLWRDVQRELHIADMRSQFVSSVSHELRTPLTSIRMFAETLRLGRWKDPETQAEYLDTIVSESERLTRLVDNVLDFSRIERGSKVYQMKPVELLSVVRAAAKAVEYPLSRRGLKLHTDVEDRLPPVKADPDALEQAVLNLLTNAMKYSRDSGRIDLRLRRTDGWAVIEVSDQGIGIVAEEQKRIFEKFYRAPARENELIPGTGLGLTLVDHTVKAHRGEVTVRSEPGKGSTFSIRLPLENGQWRES